jgi:glycerol uptake facilitator-like aquaporin
MLPTRREGRLLRADKHQHRAAAAGLLRMPVTPDLPRKAAAEAVGTAFLVAAVIGSGIAAQRLSPHDVGLQLLENSLVTGAALIALILALQPVSAAFNPAVTLVETALGDLRPGEAATLIGAQTAGGVLGAVTANLMFNLQPVTIAGQHRDGAGRWLSEAIATLGLLLVIFGAARTARHRVAYAVGAYITAAYWFTSSTSFANPAVTLARMFSDTFAGIAPASAAPFIAMQLLGAALGYLLIRALFPTPSTAPPPAAPAAATAARQAVP